MTLDMEFELDVPFDMQFGDWLPASPSSQDAVLFIPQNLTKDEQEQARKNIGAAKEEKNIAYLYTSLPAAVADLNSSTTENADATDENAVCAIYTDSDGNTRLMLLSDIELTESITFEVPVVFDLNSYAVLINGDYRIVFDGDNSVVDGRTGYGQVIMETETNTVSYCLRFNGNNCKILGGFYSMTAPADVKMVCCVLINGDSAIVDGVTVRAEAVSGLKYAYGILGMRNCKIINSDIQCNSSAGSSYGVYGQSKTEIISLKTSVIQATSQSADAGCSVYTLSGYNLRASKCKLSAESENCDSCGILVQTDGNFQECEVYINSIHGKGQCLYNAGITLAENCIFFADGTTGSVSEGNENYAGTQGVYNIETITLNNCKVYGTHTGFQCAESSKNTINGGLFEGPGHGGVYVACDNGGQFYAENTTFRNAPYRGNNKSEYYYGNGQYMVAAVYVGGGDNIKAYFDNCILDGSGPELIPDNDENEFLGAEPIRFRHSDGEQNNSAYISNCTLMGDGKIRFANSTHKLHLGFCNRLLCEPNLESCMVDEGRKVYTGYEAQVMV